MIDSLYLKLIDDNRSFVLQFEDLMTELSCHVCVRDGTNRHLVQHLGVLLYFVLLELVHGKLSLVDSNEVDKFAVLLNVYVGLLDTSL